MSTNKQIAEFLACNGAQMLPIFPKDIKTKAAKDLSVASVFKENCESCIVKNGMVYHKRLEEIIAQLLSGNMTSTRPSTTVEEAVNTLEKTKNAKRYLFPTEDQLIDFFLFLFRTDDFFVWGDRIYTTKSWGKPPNRSQYKKILIIQHEYAERDSHTLMQNEESQNYAKEDLDVATAFPLFFKLSGNEVILRKENFCSFLSSETSSEHSICNPDISRALAAAYFQTELQKSGGIITYAKFDSLLNKASAQIASVIQPKNKDMVRDFISQHCSCAVTEDSFAYARRNEQWESFCRAWFREHLSRVNKAIDGRFVLDERGRTDLSFRNDNRFAILASHSSKSGSTSIKISPFNHDSSAPTCNALSDGCSRKNKKKRKNKNQKPKTEQVASITPNNDESGSEQEWFVVKNKSRSRRSNLMPGAHHTSETIKGMEMEETVSNTFIGNNSTIPLAKRNVMQKQKLRGYGEKRTNDIPDSETSKQRTIKYVSGRQKQLKSASRFDSASSVSSLPTSSEASQSSSSTQYLNDVAADSSGKPKMSRLGVDSVLPASQVKEERSTIGLNKGHAFLHNHPPEFSKDFTLSDVDKIDVCTKMLSDVTAQNRNFPTSITGINKQIVREMIERTNRAKLIQETTYVSVFNAEASPFQGGFLKVEHTRKVGQKNVQSLPRPVVAPNSAQRFQRKLVWPQTLRTISSEPTSTRTTMNPCVPEPVFSHPAHCKVFKTFNEKHISVLDHTLVSGKQTSARKPCKSDGFQECSRFCKNGLSKTPILCPFMFQETNQTQMDKSTSTSSWNICHFPPAPRGFAVKNNNLKGQTKHQLSSTPTPLSDDHAIKNHCFCSNNPSTSSSSATSRNNTTSENGNFDQCSCADISAEMKLKETYLAKMLPEMSFASSDINKPVTTGPVPLAVSQPSRKCLSLESHALPHVTCESDTCEQLISSLLATSASDQQTNINVLYARLLRHKPNSYQSVFELSTFVENSKIFSLKDCMVQWNNSFKI